MDEAPSAPGTPRWVKAFAVIALLVALLVVVSLLFGIKHGPGRHGTSVGTPAAERS